LISQSRGLGDVYKRQVLQEVEGNSLKATSPAHIAIADGNSNPGMMYRIPFNNSFDGNTVELNVEQAQYGQAAGEYQATLNILEARITGLKRALRGD
jgi:flagellar basal-body rod protein FlgB